jgi:hypothetical protein
MTRRSTSGSTNAGRNEETARRQNALIMFEDESGVAVAVGAADLGPQGPHPGAASSVRLEAAVTGRCPDEPDGSAAHLFFQLRSGAYNDETLIEFRTDVHHLEQGRVLSSGTDCPRIAADACWNGSPVGTIGQRIESLPACAPDVNPIEYVWGNLKSTELR